MCECVARGAAGRDGKHRLVIPMAVTSSCVTIYARICLGDTLVSIVESAPVWTVRAQSGANSAKIAFTVLPALPATELL